jgi:hypothetical protein
MKLLPLVLGGSLVANLTCALVLTLRPALAPPGVRDFFHLHDEAADKRLAEEARRRDEATAKGQAAQAAAGHAQLWSALDSSDLKALVARLKAAGFTSDVIRSIVSARLEARFSARRKEIATAVAETPYWKTEPNAFNGNPKLYEEMSQLYRERTRLMREILGDDFFNDSAGETTAAQFRQYGDLPKAKIDLIQRINDDYAEMNSQVKAAMQGVTLPEDREKMALLEKEKRADLAAILTPEELKAYEMRSSTVATRIRAALGIMDATEEEFRKIYDVQQSLVEQLYPTGGVKGAEMSRIRKEAQQQVDEQLVAALGAQRAAEFKRAGDYDYQQLYRLAQQEKLPATTATQVYDVRSAAAKESERIYKDSTLSLEAKLAALQTLGQTTKTQFVSLLGPNAGDNYVKSATWLTHIQNGGSVSFSGDGGSSFYSPLAATPAPKK